MEEKFSVTPTNSMTRQLKNVKSVYFQSYQRYRSFIGLLKKLKIKAGKLKANISKRNTLNKREIQIYTKQKNLFNIYQVQVQGKGFTVLLPVSL